MNDMVGLMAVGEEGWTILPSGLNPFTTKQSVAVHMMLSQEFAETESTAIAMNAELGRMWAALDDLERWMTAIEDMNDHIREIFGLLRTSGHCEPWHEMTKLPKLFDAVYAKVMGAFNNGEFGDDHRSLSGNALLTCAFVHGLSIDDIERLKDMMTANGLNNAYYPLHDFWHPRVSQRMLAPNSLDAAMRMAWVTKTDLEKQIRELEGGNKSQLETEALDKLKSGQKKLHKKMMAEDCFFEPTDAIVCEVYGMALGQQTQMANLVAHMWEERGVL